jgi:methylglutaconyl-CoA hydratase
MIQINRDGGVLRVVLARPEGKNALNAEMVAVFRDALAKARRDVRAIVLESAVPGYFSIGMDLVSLDAGISAGATSPQVHAGVGEYAELLKDLLAIRVPTIAAINGMAVGGGVDLLAACDLAIASSNAVFSIAQLRKGIFPLTTSGVVAPRIGQRAFLYWVLSGQNYSAKKARRLGLISQIVAPERLAPRIDQLVEQILGYDADVLRLGMDAMRVAPNLTPSDRLDHLGALLALNCQVRRGPGE